MSSDGVLAPIEGGGTTEQIPLSPAYRATLGALKRSGRHEVEEDVALGGAIMAGALAAGRTFAPHHDLQHIKDGWRTMETAGQDLAAGTFLRYSGRFRLGFQTYNYTVRRFLFFKKHRCLKVVHLLITGQTLFLPAAVFDALSSTSGDVRSVTTPHGTIRTVETTGGVDFASHSEGVLQLRGPGGTTLYESEYVRVA